MLDFVLLGLCNHHHIELKPFLNFIQLKGLIFKGPLNDRRLFTIIKGDDIGICVYISDLDPLKALYLGGEIVHPSV